MSRSHPESDSPPGGLFPPLLEAAVRLAARGHYNQFRKSMEDLDGNNPSGAFLPDRVPYVTHLMGTMCILARLGVRDEVLAAAVLHDYLEDVPDPDGRENIRLALGEEVLSLVLEVTENKRRGLDQVETWEVRKREQLGHVAEMPEEAVLIKAADVLHNMQSLTLDLEAAEDVEAVWRHFNAGPEQQLWYFASLTAAVENRLGDHPLATELRRAFNNLAAALEP
jgi:(p)ppGpp synthase/HD superfamily hydrolase